MARIAGAGLRGQEEAGEPHGTVRVHLAGALRQQRDARLLDCGVLDEGLDGVQRAGVQIACSINATTPVTAGAAMLVPLRVRYAPVPRGPTPDTTELG